MKNIACKLERHKGNGKDGIKEFQVAANESCVIAIPFTYGLNRNAVHPVIKVHSDANGIRVRAYMNRMAVLFMVASNAVAFHMAFMQGELTAIIIVPPACLACIYFFYFRVRKTALETVHQILSKD